MIACFVIAVGAGLIARATALKEDASLAAFFLISLALGVTIVSVKGSNVDLLHFLFGSVLAVDDPALILIVSIASASPTVTNTASVTGGGDSLFHSASDVTNINTPTLAITK